MQGFVIWKLKSSLVNWFMTTTFSIATKSGWNYLYHDQNHYSKDRFWLQALMVIKQGYSISLIKRLCTNVMSKSHISGPISHVVPNRDLNQGSLKQRWQVPSVPKGCKGIKHTQFDKTLTHECDIMTCCQSKVLFKVNKILLIVICQSDFDFLKRVGYTFILLPLL